MPSVEVFDIACRPTPGSSDMPRGQGRVWNAQTGQELQKFICEKPPIAVGFASNGESVFSAGGEPYIREWQVASTASLEWLGSHAKRASRPGLQRGRTQEKPRWQDGRTGSIGRAFREMISVSASIVGLDAGVRAASDLGYRCVVVHDACATRDEEFAGKVVPAAEVHAAFMAALQLGYATLRSTREYLAASPAK